MQKHIEDLLQREMSRKEFLATVGFGVATVFGFSSVLKLLGGGKHHAVQAGYGSSPYGGNGKKAA